MKLFIIHPGIQHSPRLANGALRSGLFEKVILHTSILFKPNQKVFGLLKKRVKPIDEGVQISNHYLYSILFSASKYLYNKIIINPNNQSHNNPIYFWQQIFGLICLPTIYLNRKNLVVLCFETTGWPLVKYCKKWNIPLIMDFASISHEKAKTLGINETAYGISLKTKERALIDYGFYCSDFCRKSFEGLTSSKKDFVLYLGAEEVRSSEYQELSEEGRKSKDEGFLSDEGEILKYKVESSEFNDSVKRIKISFIANLEYRKGLDIFLDAIYSFNYSHLLEVYLIGKIRPEWVDEHMPKEITNTRIKLHYQSAMSQQELFAYLKAQQFDLNVQCSRFDSFAMVVPETMMQGIPNIVSPFVGAGEMIKNGIDGYIMPELNSDSLYAILQGYMNLSCEGKISLKQNVLESSKNMFWENYYMHLGKAFKTILIDIK